MATQEQITKRDILNILFRNKWKIILVIVFSSLVGIAGAYILPNKFTAESKVLIKLGREISPLPSGQSGGGTVMVSKREEDINSEIEIITSAFLVNKVVSMMEDEFNKEEIPVTLIQKLKHQLSIFLKFVKARIENTLIFLGLKTELTPYEKLLGKVQKRLKIEPSELTDVILVQFSWKDPETTAKFVSLLVDQYQEYHLRVHRNNKALNFFKDQVAFLDNKLTASKQKLQNFKKQYDLVQFDTEKNLLLKRIDKYQTSTKELFSEVKKYQAQVDTLENKINYIPNQIILSKEEQKNPFVLSNLEQQLAQLLVDEKDLTSRYFNENKQIKIIQSQISLMKSQIKKEQDRIYGSTTTGVNQNWLDLNILLIRAMVQLESSKAKLHAEQATLESFNLRIKQLRDIEDQYNHLEQQVSIDNKNYLLYENKMEQSRIEVAMDEGKLSSVRVIQPAMVPKKPVSPKRILIILLSVVMGFFGGISLSFFLDFIDTSVRTPQDIENLDIPYLGTLLNS